MGKLRIVVSGICLVISLVLIGYGIYNIVQSGKSKNDTSCNKKLRTTGIVMTMIGFIILACIIVSTIWTNRNLLKYPIELAKYKPKENVPIEIDDVKFTQIDELSPFDISGLNPFSNAIPIAPITQFTTQSYAPTETMMTTKATLKTIPSVNETAVMPPPQVIQASPNSTIDSLKLSDISSYMPDIPKK